MKTNEFALFRTIGESLTSEDWSEIITTTINLAKAGDADARAFIAAYVLGRPQECKLTLSNIDVTERMQNESTDMLNSLYPKREKR